MNKEEDDIELTEDNQNPFNFIMSIANNLKDLKDHIAKTLMISKNKKVFFDDDDNFNSSIEDEKYIEKYKSALKFF